MNAYHPNTDGTSTPGQPAPNHEDARPLRVLMVGPTTNDVGRVRQALDAWQPQITIVPDAETARACLAQQRYDLIVALLPAPGTDGAALCRRLRAAAPMLPFVALDAAGASDDVVVGLNAGVDVYLVEPIPVAELQARLEALLRRDGAIPLGRQEVASSTAPPVSAPSGGSGPTRPAVRRKSRPATRLAGVALAVALIGTSALGGYMVQAAQRPAAASNAATTTADTTSASTTASGASAAAVNATVEHAFAVASPSVVYVDNVGVGTGSGVIYDASGDIVTNAHVVAGAQKLTVTLSTGKTYTARLVGTDTADDLAVIHIDASGLPAAHFAPASSYQVAETVLAIGNPLDLQQSVTSGLISALNRTVQESNGAYLPNAIQTSAPINPGNSGGALVDLSGAVVGIPTLEASDPQNNNGGAAQGIGFAVPSSRVTTIAQQLISTGKVTHTGRAYLGVAAVDAQQAQSTQGSGGYFGGGSFGPGGQGSTTTPSVSGALVQSVSGPAAQAGVQQGDVITAFDGTPITGEDDLLTALAHQKPGATATLTLNRNGSTVTVHVTLGELPANPS